MSDRPAQGLSGYPPDLLAAACRGDDHAIGELLRRAQPDIRRYARRTCRTTGDVEDAVQEVLLIMHRRMGSLSGIVSLAGWLFVVSQRVCLALTKAMIPGIDLSILPTAAVARADPADLRVDLARGIESLPQHYREVLVLRDVEGLTIAEIAASIGASGMTVKARLHRARKLMRDYLA